MARAAGVAIPHKNNELASLLWIEELNVEILSLLCLVPCPLPLWSIGDTESNSEAWLVISVSSMFPLLTPVYQILVILVLRTLFLLRCCILNDPLNVRDLDSCSPPVTRSAVRRQKVLTHQLRTEKVQNCADLSLEEGSKVVAELVDGACHLFPALGTLIISFRLVCSHARTCSMLRRNLTVSMPPSPTCHDSRNVRLVLLRLLQLSRVHSRGVHQGWCCASTSRNSSWR